MDAQRPRILSLCSGYGGLDIAVERLTGGRTVAVAETHPGAVRVLAKRFPMAVNIGDIRHADWWAVGTEFRPPDRHRRLPVHGHQRGGKGSGNPWRAIGHLEERPGLCSGRST